jgi:hypothetical protein
MNDSSNRAGPEDANSAEAALREEIYRLASGALWGELSEDEARRLESLVTGSRNARRWYVEFVCDACNLTAYAKGSVAASCLPVAIREPLSATTSRPVRPAGPRLKSPVLGFLSGIASAGGRIPRAIAGIATAVCIVVVGLVVMFRGVGFQHDQPLADQQNAGQAGAGQAHAGPGARAGTPTPDSAVAGPVGPETGGAAKPQSPVAERLPSVAKLVRAVDCRWADGAAAPKAGDPLPAGAKLELESGTAEVVFDVGARALLQGPSTLEIHARDAACLERGSVTVDNPTSRNFEFFAPGMKYLLVDSEFGLKIASATEQEVHVFRGNIAAAKWSGGPGGRGQFWAARDRGQAANVHGLPASPSPGATAEPILLSANQAVRVGPPGKPIERFPADEKRFLRADRFAALNARQSPEFRRWDDYRKKLAKDADLIAYYDFQPDESDLALLRNRASGSRASGSRASAERAASGTQLDGHIEGAKWVDGHLPGKQALRFAGPKDAVRVNIPGRFEVLTAAVWLKVEGLDHPAASIIDSDGRRVSVGQCHWEFFANGGVAMIPCFSTTRTAITPATWTLSPRPVLLPDDRGGWRHLAVVYDSRAKSITYFKNGRSYGAAHPDALIPLVFGPSQIGNWDSNGRKEPGRNFRGRIGELVLLARALPEKEVNELYEAGRNRPD